ncbi:MAG: hypothetical protein PSX79_09395 [bacterium]|nr:hypothetical protein [bacterium]
MTLRTTMLAALAAGLTFAGSAALAATPAPCSHLQAQSPPSNPKDVFRTALRVCDMPADCGDDGRPGFPGQA